MSAARFSIESRTVSLQHVYAGLAAPNVDGLAPRVIPEWFEHVVTGERPTMAQLGDGPSPPPTNAGIRRRASPRKRSEGVWSN